MTTATVARTVHVEHCMGTVFTIDIRDVGDWREPIGAVVRWLHHIDAVFSTYRPDSPISRLRKGDPEFPVGAELASVLALCAHLRTATLGYFDAEYDGKPDPTGVVKGLAVERASRILGERGSRNHAVNGGGDIQLSGDAAPGRPWRVGINDPHDRSRVLTTVSGNDLAVATSGTAERGQHVVDPHTGRPAVSLASATVTGPSLTYADAYATAALAMGERAIGWLANLSGYQGMVVGSDGNVEATAGFHAGA